MHRGDTASARCCKTAIAVIAFTALLAQAGPAASQSLSEDIYAKASNTTVFVVVDYVDRNTGVVKTEYGTGFIVSERGDILTADHVVREWLAQSGEDKAKHPIRVSIGSKYSPLHETSFEVADEPGDVALLRLREPLRYPMAPVCYANELSMGAYMTGFGYPNNHDLLPVAGIFGNANGEDNRWQVAVPFARGMSGGPVFDARGFVVGLVHGGVDGSPTDSLVTPVRWAKALMESRTSVKQACFGTCRLEANGVESWGTSTPWAQDSEWVGGGHTQGGECGKLAAIFMQTHPGSLLTIDNMSERSNKDLFGHATYQYICSGTVRSDPVYRQKESPLCPPP